MSAASATVTSASMTAQPALPRAPRRHRRHARIAPPAPAGAARVIHAAVATPPLFLAYAAHELRGEVALQRTLAEVALADPSAGEATLRQMGERVVAACERQERLLTALLTLSKSESGRLRGEPVDIAASTAEVLRGHDHRGLRATAALEPARTNGDRLLVERLIANLVANAIRHNVPGGRLDIATYTAAGRAVFAIANTGPTIAPGELSRLFQPFQRLRSDADPSADGAGLGLSIVQAIANAHDATVSAEVRVGGGLRIDAAFPALD